MKTIILVSIFFTLIILYMCDNNDNPKPDDIPFSEWIQGLWISNENDTLCIKSVLTFNGSYPYSYNFMDDSVSLFPVHCSNFANLKFYPYTINKTIEKLTIYSFFEYDSITFFKRNNECEL